MDLKKCLAILIEKTFEILDTERDFRRNLRTIDTEKFGDKEGSLISGKKRRKRNKS